MQKINGSDKNWVRLVYALQGLSLLTVGFTAVAGVVINYLKMDAHKGTWLESHHRWQIRTFWWSLVWAGVVFVVGILFFWLPPLVWLLGAGTSLWFIYRFVKGWVRLGDELPMYM